MLQLMILAILCSLNTEVSGQEDESSIFRHLPEDVKTELMTTLSDSINDYTKRVLINVKQFSESFRKDLQLGNLSLSNGELVQSISINVGTNISSTYHELQEVIFVSIPAVVPFVRFKYNYRLQLNGKVSTGKIRIDVTDQSVLISLAILRGDDRSCYMNPMDLSFNKQLKNYNVHPTYYPGSRFDLGAIQSEVAQQIMNSWLFSDYKEQVKAFTFTVLRESLVKATGVLQRNKAFNDLCRFIQRFK